MEGDREPLEVLLELTRLLAGERSLEEALQATTDAALEMLPCDHASLRLFDERRRELLSTARSGAGAGKKPAPFRAGEGVLGVVADTGRAALVTDTATDPRFEERSTGFSVGSLVAAPLIAGGHVVGVLSASSAAANGFAERHRDLAQLLANCAAPAIETARLARLAVTDDLTRAFNHRYLSSRLPEEVGRARRYGDRFSVLMMDLDHFKQVNDAHGHAVGDEVLRGFVERVRAEVREPDVLIRRGGEEFVLLMPSTRITEAAAVAERIRARVADRPIATKTGGDVALTVSIGVATWEPDEPGREVEGRADAALYRAKEGGRDRVIAAE
jgi:diguanylate cyclase (GGDEF)-like protein